MRKGYVWLVGAGPGDAGLLTLKGKRVLEEADVIVYDHLVNRDILELAGDGKKWINVGKKAGHHPVPQEEIQKILKEEAQAGEKVVRLKGGDPFLFGRGGEEAEALAEDGIPFEIVPGVTSALAVPAYNGIPVTHRDHASSVHIITGHKRADGTDGIPYRELVRVGGTLVFLMGVTALPQIMEGLMEAGMDGDTPAAILQEGTTAGQRRVEGTLRTLEERARQAQIRPPAVIVVGGVCTLASRLSWYEKLPLMGMRIVLTRPRDRMGELAEKLRKRGAQVLEAPAIETVELQENRKLEQAIAELDQYQWIVFTSQAGVQLFFQALARKRLDVRRLGGIQFAVIGEGTAAALEERGVYPDRMPQIYDGESLGRLLAGEEICGKRILIPRAEKGNPLLVPLLEEAGAQVDDVAIYRTVYRDDPDGIIRQELEKGRADCVVFTSSSTVDGFAAAAQGMDLTGLTAVCIGERTAQTARSYHMDCRTAEQATIDSLVELIERIRGEHD